MSLLLLLFALRAVVCYNLETSHPIIYEAPDDRGKDAYFGMSVAIRPKSASLDDAWTVQVGAPRGGEEGAAGRGPGAVYRCHTYGPCRSFAFGKGLTPSGGYGVHEYKEKKDEAWIGVAMDVESVGRKERSVVCGHRWMNENLKNPENIDVTYLVTGVCYLQDLLNDSYELPVQRLLPLVNKDKIYTPKPYVDDLSTYHWGLGQAGLSVKLTEDSSGILIGAPGVTHWIGSVIRYDENFQMTVANFARTEIARKSRYAYLAQLKHIFQPNKMKTKRPQTDRRKEQFILLTLNNTFTHFPGYSIAFGRFYKDRELWFVAGAPRSSNYHGEIFTFQFKGSSSDVRVQSSFAGATFGEYFGSSLTTADLNNDGFDDIIVGAPLYSNKDPDEGRIYVYLGTGQGSFLLSAQVINGRVGHGRFGSCVTSIRDLDQDGYGDVAVGAPYEDDQKGAVYVYRGFSKGLQMEYSQRIRAQDIHPHLRGFGVSISPAVDIDGNKYFDIAVGSHLSGHAVLLRSRPVISLHPKIKTENIGLIDRRDSYVNVTVCLRYSGSNAPSNVDINRVIDVDPLYDRGTLDLSTSSLSKVVRLRANQIICEILPIKLQINRDNYSPLQVAVRTEIVPCSNGKRRSLLINERKPREADGFQKACPVGNAVEISKEIAFAGICGPDLTCQSDLEISCGAPDFRDGSYTIGSTEYFALSVDIKNYGEPAYDTRIKIWSNMKLTQRNVASLNGSRTHWVDIDGILSDSYRAEYPFQIDLAHLAEIEGETTLNLMVEIFTSSTEENLNNNNCKFSILLQTDSSLDFRASSSVSSIYITKEMLKEQTFSVTHYYEVQKTGVTPVKDAELTIYVPFYFEKEFLTFEVETSEWVHFSHHYEKSTQEGTNLGKKGENCPPTNRTLFLNCSNAENDCKILKMFFTGGIPTGFSSYAKIIMSLNVTAVDRVKKERDIVFLSTIGTLKFSKFLEKPSELQATASLSLYNEERDLRVAAHIIALSILAGGFLLSLIVTGLVKSNFFKRAKKQELKALKDAEATFVYFATGSSVQGSC